MIMSQTLSENCCHFIQEFLKEFLSFHIWVPIHTPLEGESGSGKFSRLMTLTQLFYDISGTQNRKDQNFLPRTFSVISILRYPTFPYCFYYIAILQLSHFREIFTKCLATSDRMYLENYNFLRFSLTSIGISWWINFWDHLTTSPPEVAKV